MMSNVLVAPSAGLVRPKITSVAVAVNSVPKPDAFGGVTWGGATSSGVTA